jgi:aspartate 1-decarboxylase
VLIQVLKSKIHRATVTEAALHYEGSLTLGPELIRAAGLAVNEKVLVANIDAGTRFETYIIEGTEGTVCLNGAAARLGEVGDRVIVMAFGMIEADRAEEHAPRIVHVDAENRPRPEA